MMLKSLYKRLTRGLCVAEENRGAPIPWYLGWSYYDARTRCDAYHVLPVSLAVRGWRWFHYRINRRPAWLYRIMTERLEAGYRAGFERGYRRGYDRGRRDVAREIEARLDESLTAELKEKE